MNHSQLFSSASANFHFVPFASVARGEHSISSLSSSSLILNTEPGSIIDDQGVTRNDVLGDRGKGSASREGNQFYSRVIKEHKDEYQKLKKTKLKRMLVLRVLDIFKNREPKGRFLKGTGGKKKEWIIQNDTFALKKIAQALREKPKDNSSQTKQIDMEMDSTPNKTQEENKGGFTRKRWKTTPSSNRKNHYGHENDYDSNDDDDDQDESIATDEIVRINILDEVYKKPVKRPLTSHQVNQSDHPMPRYLIKLLETATK